MSDAPERIWAWYFIESKRDDVIKGGWDDAYRTILQKPNVNSCNEYWPEDTP